MERMMPLIEKDNQPNYLVLNEAEAKGLYEYFMKAGYISREYHEDIHILIKRLSDFLGEE